MPAAASRTSLTHEERRERRREIAEAVRSGAGIGDVAKQFGVSTATVDIAIKEFGVDSPKRKGVLARAVEMASRYADGLTMQQVADEFGVDFGTVAYAIRKLDIQARMPGRAPNIEQHKKVVRFAIEHHSTSVADIAKELGIPEPTVANTLQEYGVSTNGHSYTELLEGTYSIIADLVNTSDTLEAIGQRHGVTRERVRQIAVRCRKAGIQTMKPWKVK
jgi:transposase-like protein